MAEIPEGRDQPATSAHEPHPVHVNVSVGRYETPSVESASHPRPSDCGCQCGSLTGSGHGGGKMAAD